MELQNKMHAFSEVVNILRNRSVGQQLPITGLCVIRLRDFEKLHSTVTDECFFHHYAIVVTMPILQTCVCHIAWTECAGRRVRVRRVGLCI